MKIFAVYLCDYKDRNDYYLSLMPYGITTIAAYLEQEGHEVTLANFSSYGYLKAVELTIAGKPYAVAVSIFSFNRTESFKYIRELKRRDKNIVVVAGGQHPTFLADQIISHYPEIDFLVKGEGEYSIKQLADKSFRHDEKIVSSERITNLDTIRFPSLFNGKTIGVNPNEQFKYIITSRGCPSNCTYCSSPNFWNKKVTYRSPENIVNELKHINEKFGIIYFSIRDDNFTLNKKRVLEFCRLLDESRLYMMWNCQARVDTIDEEMLTAMKKSGLEHIQFGVESGSEKILKIYDKHITPEKIRKASAITRKVGVYLSFYLMTGMTGETTDDIEDTKKLVQQTKPHDVIVSPVAYYPGTKIYTTSMKKGNISDNIWFNSEENGLYLNKQSTNDRNIDFQIHRQLTGDNCWMNYIIEGDHYSAKSDIKKASLQYLKLIENYPDNIWGYLRMAEVLSAESDIRAIEYFVKATELVPSYYGSWMRLAQIEYLSGKISRAKTSISKALKLNPFEPEISRLAGLINNKNDIKSL
ncbi:MAG: hypothetical protein CVV49_04985 [Spirochaetae bacterium HGW-Spirochaetae-5]|nr:MAG: hypothetical protein CVV49_04985 [Spirochaetae bacterium HGW-Spirochaetae-5]